MGLGRYCGVSLQDCARLKSTHLSRDGWTFLFPIIGPGCGLRIPIGPRLRDSLMLLTQPGCRDVPLFLSCFNLSIAALEDEFTRLLIIAGVGRSKGAASNFRHCDLNLVVLNDKSNLAMRNGEGKIGLISKSL